MDKRLSQIIESQVISNFNKLPTAKQVAIVTNDGTLGFIEASVHSLYLSEEQTKEYFSNKLVLYPLCDRLLEMTCDSYIAVEYNATADRTEAWRIYYVDNKENITAIEFYDYSMGSIELNQSIIDDWGQEIAYEY